MTYEKDIPAYALQVAKAPQKVPCSAIYHTEKMMSPGEKQVTCYQLEEDILVPDIKDDMEEILLMIADCDISPTERKLSQKMDERLNLTGVITLQTLYRPEKADCLPVSMTAKVPYQYQWQLHCDSPAEGYFQCRVKNLEYMIINERKFRIKVILEFTCMLFMEQEIPLFQGLEQEHLELKHEEISLCCLEAVKKETLDIDQWMEDGGGKIVPLELLHQQYTMIENYRQVTSEKIVLNGFLFVELLYRGQEEDGPEKLCCQRERIEFTQFIPLEKKMRGKKWSVVKTVFQNKGINAVLETKEDGAQAFHVKGPLETCLFLYEDRKQEMVTDAYHLEKGFSGEFRRQGKRSMIFSESREINVRERISLPDDGKGQDAVCAYCYPRDWECQPEKGCLRISIKLESISLWKNETGYQITKTFHHLQNTLDIDGMDPSVEVSVDMHPKDFRVTFINDRQLELIGSVTFCCDGSKGEDLLLLENPSFFEGELEKGPSMVITVAEAGESLWSLAKRYRTTETKIREMNHMGEGPAAGQKLLIIK